MPRNQHYNIMDKNIIKEFMANVFGKSGEYMPEQIKRQSNIIYRKRIEYMFRVLPDDIISDFSKNKEICSEFIDDYISLIGLYSERDTMLNQKNSCV